MAFRIELAPCVGSQVNSLPEGAYRALKETLLVLMEDPAHPELVEPSEDPGRLRASFGDFGIIEFQPWIELGVIVIHRIIWAG